jgi:ribosome maturation protein Sdo1
VFNFRNEKEGTPYTEDTYYMSIEDFSAFYNSSDKKSINKLDIVQNGGIIIDAKQRKKLYNYNVKKMLEDIVAQREET